MDYFSRMYEYYRGDPTSMPNFQRQNPKFRLDSRQNSSRLEVYYFEKGLDF
jgi:hypothetical protein